MTAWSTASVALALLLFAACGAESSPSTADDPTSTPSTTSSPPAVTQEPTSWMTTIPDQLPLAVHLPADGGDFSVTRIRSETEAVAVDLCGAVDMSDHSLDLAGWRATGPEYEESRQLRLYTSEVEARAAFGAVVERIPSCAAGERQLEQRASILPGDDSATIVETYQTPGGLTTLGATFLELVRVGNAVLLTRSYGEWDPESNLDGGIARHAEEVAPIIEAMGVFAAG